MKKYMYIFGSLEMILGALMLCVSSAIKEIIPVWAYVEFQKQLSGSYDPTDYAIQLSVVTTICAVLIFAGIVQIILGLISKSEQHNRPRPGRAADIPDY